MVAAVNLFVRSTHLVAGIFSDVMASTGMRLEELTEAIELSQLVR